MLQQYNLLWFPVKFHSCRIRITRMTFWHGKGKTANYLVDIANRGNYLSQHFTHISTSSSKKGRMINPTSYKRTSMAMFLLAHYLGSTTLVLTLFHKNLHVVYSHQHHQGKIHSQEEKKMACIWKTFKKELPYSVTPLNLSQKNQFMKRGGKVETLENPNKTAGALRKHKDIQSRWWCWAVGWERSHYVRPWTR